MADCASVGRAFRVLPPRQHVTPDRPLALETEMSCFLTVERRTPSSLTLEPREDGAFHSIGTQNSFLPFNSRRFDTYGGWPSIQKQKPAPERERLQHCWLNRSAAFSARSACSWQAAFVCIEAPYAQLMEKQKAPPGSRAFVLIVPGYWVEAKRYIESPGGELAYAFFSGITPATLRRAFKLLIWNAKRSPAFNGHAHLRQIGPHGIFGA